VEHDNEFLDKHSALGLVFHIVHQLVAIGVSCDRQQAGMEGSKAIEEKIGMDDMIHILHQQGCQLSLRQVVPDNHLMRLKATLVGKIIRPHEPSHVIIEVLLMETPHQADITVEVGIHKHGLKIRSSLVLGIVGRKGLDDQLGELEEYQVVVISSQHTTSE
jgi:hypothetical protein